VYARGGLSEVLRDEGRSESRRIEREKKRPCCADRKYRKGKEEEREKEGKRGPDRTFLPRTGPRQNVIMLIRDWFENVKCTRQSTAGYHEPPSIGFLSLVLSPRRSLLSPSFSPPFRAQIFMESSSSRARYIPLRSLVSRLVLSRRGPGDQKRFNLRYHRWRAKPRLVSSPDFGGFDIRDETRLTTRVTEYRRHWRLSFSARSKNKAALSAASANFFNRVLPLTRANLEARRVTSNKRYRDRRKRSCNLERAPISKFICLDADKPMRRHSRVSVIYSLA